MKRDQIITAAETTNAKEFVTLLDKWSVAFMVLDMDNIMDPNDGYLNLAIEGLDKGETLLFVDGVFSGQ